MLQQDVVYVWRENVARIEPDMSPQQPESCGLRHLGAMLEQVYQGRKFDAVRQLKQAIVIE